MNSKKWGEISGLVLLLVAAAVPMAVAFGQKPSEANAKKQQQFAVERRAVNRLVENFPGKTDLSTPESAMAASCRKWAQEGITAALEVSWLQLDTEIAKEVESAIKSEPKGPRLDFRQVFRNAEIIDVLTYRDDVAVVIYRESLDPARPYGGVPFGRINGVWKSLWMGLPIEDDSGEAQISCPSAQAIAKRFEGKKDDLWREFAQMRNAVQSGRTPCVDDLQPSKPDDNRPSE